MNRRKTILARGKISGQATVEYTVVLIAAVLILVARPSVIDDVVTALKDTYESFVYALSWSDVPVSMH
jgi:Flp pilus assembly pilin Flp